MFAHPGGVDEGEAGEVVPGLAEVYLMRVEFWRGGVGDDFVADDEEGLWGGRWGLWISKVVVDEGGFDGVLFLEDEVAKGDGSVRIGVGVDCGDLVDGD